MLEDYDKATSEKILGHALVYVSPEINFSEKNDKNFGFEAKIKGLKTLFQQNSW